MSETNKPVALVTGGSRGIGKAVSIRLASDGYHVVINYRSNEEAARQTKREIEENGGSADLLPFDVADERAVETALNEWKKAHTESVSVLVNNAGIVRDAALIWMEKEQWDAVINTNLNGFFYVTRLLIKDMMIARNGRIVNIVSLSGQKGLPGQTNYAAAKAGVIGATKALALEVARKNVLVNAVAPGFIASDMTADLDEKTLKKEVPLRRFGRPEEVAGVVSFLVSDDASYITGTVISVNGGLYT